jgi:hypothetical protein
MHAASNWIELRSRRRVSALLRRYAAISGQFHGSCVTLLLHERAMPAEKGLTANRRKSLCHNECRRQDLNLHSLDGN